VRLSAQKFSRVEQAPVGQMEALRRAFQPSYPVGSKTVALARQQSTAQLLFYWMNHRHRFEVA